MNNKAHGSLMSSVNVFFIISHCSSRNHCHFCLISRSFFSLSDWKEALQLNYYSLMATFFFFFFTSLCLHIEGTPQPGHVQRAITDRRKMKEEQTDVKRNQVYEYGSERGGEIRNKV